MKKRMLALALMVAMLLSVLPVQVFAKETATGHTEHNFAALQPETAAPTEQPEQTEQPAQTEQPEQTEQAEPSEEIRRPEGTRGAEDFDILTSADYVAAVNAAKGDVEYLVQTIGPRTMGSANERRALDFAALVFDELGYTVERQEVDLGSWGVGNVFLGDLTLAAAVPNNAVYGTAEGTAVYLDDPADVASLGEDLSGKIVFFPGNWRKIGATYVHPETYSAIAALNDANAEAVVVLLDLSVYPDEVNKKAFSSMNCNDFDPRINIPVLLTASMEAERVPAYLDGKENVNVKVETLNAAKSQNVIGVKKAKVDTDLTIYVSAHVDTVKPSPGANDNASGVAGLLALARAFKNVETNYNIHFIAFCAEEYTLVGSDHLALNLSEEEIANAIGNYNMDMIASPYCDYLCLDTYTMKDASDDAPVKHTHVTRIAWAAAQALGLPAENCYVDYGGLSDHVAFHDVGIPAVAFTREIDRVNHDVEPENHTAMDNMDNFSEAALKETLDVVALALYNDATANYVAVVGEGVYKEFYTDMTEAENAAAESGATLRDLRADSDGEGDSHAHCVYGENCADIKAGNACTHGTIWFDQPLGQAELNAIHAANSDKNYVNIPSGRYYLTENVSTAERNVANGILFNDGGEVYICLNGHTLDAVGTKSKVISIQNQTKVYICECDINHETGRFTTNDLTVGHVTDTAQTGELYLLGGEMVCSVEYYAYAGTDSKIVVDGGKLLLKTASTVGGALIYSGDATRNAHYPLPSCIELISGSIAVEGDAAAVGNYGCGYIQLSGDIQINAGTNRGDFYLDFARYPKMDSLITITGKLSGSEVYTVELGSGTQDKLNDEGKYRITEGWSNAELSTIPFKSTQGYDVVLMEDGELYLVKHQHCVYGANCADIKAGNPCTHDIIWFDQPLDQKMMESFEKDGSNDYVLIPSGHYFLTSDIDMSVIVNLGLSARGGNTVYLCLNGHAITNQSRLDSREGAKLYICDCKNDPETGKNQGRIDVSDAVWSGLENNPGGGYMFHHGGTINVFDDSYTPLAVYDGGEFVLDGGTYSINNGGGENEAIYGLWYSTGLYPKLTFKSGTIEHTGDNFTVAQYGDSYVILSGTVKINNDNAPADFYLNSRYEAEPGMTVLTIAETFDPQGEIYSVYLEGGLSASRKKFRITDGWESAQLDTIPFVSAQDYAVIEMDYVRPDGTVSTELYLVELHRHTMSTDCHVSDTPSENVTFITELDLDALAKYKNGDDYVLPTGQYVLVDNIEIPKDSDLIFAGDVDLCFGELGNYITMLGASDVILVEEGAVVNLCSCNLPYGSGGFKTECSESKYFMLCEGELNIYGGTVELLSVAFENDPTVLLVEDGGQVTIYGGGIASPVSDLHTGARIEDGGSLRITGEGNINSMNTAIHVAGGTLTIDDNDGSVYVGSEYSEAVYFEDGTFNLEGSPQLSGGEGTIRIKGDEENHTNHNFIHITGEFTPSYGVCDVKIDGMYGVDEDFTIDPAVFGTSVRFTKGWAENNPDATEYPFAHYDPVYGGSIYFVKEGTNGELYFAFGAIDFELSPEDGGTASVVGYDIWTGEAIIRVEPAEDYRIASFDGIKYSFVEDGTVHVDNPTSWGNGEYRFYMPSADVTVKVIFESDYLDIPLDIYLWNGHEAVVDEETFIEVLKACDPSQKLFKENENFTYKEFIPPTVDGFTMDMYEGEDGKKYISFRAERSGLLKGSFQLSYNTHTDLLAYVGVKINVRSFELYDSVVVLDYDMDAKLGASLFAQDVLPGTIYDPNVDSADTVLIPEAFSTTAPEYTVDYAKLTQSMQVEASDGTGIYGDFKVAEDFSDVIYAPKAFMNGPDSIYVAFRAHAMDETPSTDGTVDLFKEAAMYKMITILPANVVYYEDTNAALEWAPDETEISVSQPKTDEANTVYQDPSYDRVGDYNEYGNDYNYAYASGSYTGSGGTRKEITINGNGTILRFTFTGTGFDVLGTTNAQSGSMEIVITDKDGNSDYIPLDTYYANGEIVEAPLVHKELDYGTYTVEINAVPEYDWDATEGWEPHPDPKLAALGIKVPPIKPYMLWFDGVRIYNPLDMDDENRLHHYNEYEKQAQFVQIRNLILEGKAASAFFDGNGPFTFGSGNAFYVEDMKQTQTYNGTFGDYLVKGPNNELYFNSATQSVVFYVRETAEDVPHMLQIGVRNLNPTALGQNGSTVGTPGVNLIGKDGATVQTVVSATNAIGYTEQYYTVKYTNCAQEVINEVTYYRVVLSAANNAPFCISNLKYSGLEFADIPGAENVLIYDENGELSEEVVETVDQNMPNLWSLERQLRKAYNMLPEDTFEPEDANLKFMSASLNLDDSIGMNIYVNETVLDGYEDPYVLIEKLYGDEVVYETCKVYPTKTVQYGNATCIDFLYENLAAKEMSATVRMTLYAMKDGVLTRGEVRDYSILTYAMNTLGKTTDPALKTLLVDMLNYGAQAQDYFNFHEEFLANSTLTEEQKAWATAEEPVLVNGFIKDNPSIPGSGSYPFAIASASLLLEDKVELNFFVNSGSGDLTGKKMILTYVDGAGKEIRTEISAENFVWNSNSMYKVTFDGLAAKDMRVLVTCWIADENGERMSNAATYGIECYAASKLSNEALKPMLLDMMRYGDSARNYFAARNQD